MRAALQAEGEEGWRSLAARHGGLVKPDIIFFGEELPPRCMPQHLPSTVPRRSHGPVPCYCRLHRRLLRRPHLPQPCPNLGPPPGSALAAHARINNNNNNRSAHALRQFRGAIEARLPAV